MTQSSRLPEAQNIVLSGHRIDRQRPLSFTLNGQAFTALGGDTVHSALLANGVDSAGTHLGHPLGLGESFSPWIRSSDGSSTAAAPMDRTAVADGTRYVTIAPAATSRFSRVTSRLLRRRSSSLDINFDVPSSSAPALIVEDNLPTETFDLIVVGGGVCGMAGALAAARQGLRTALIERRLYLGGDAEVFGGLEGEMSPAEQISSLKADIANDENITVIVGADAFRAAEGAVFVHVASETENSPDQNLRKLEAGKLLLATGAADRLPVFGGNRLPGIVGLSEAFHLGAAYGVWADGDTLIWGASNVIYRLGLFATDAGRRIKRIIDARGEPHGRFREFAKAYGISLANGLSIDHARLLRSDRPLEVSLRLTWGDGNGSLERVAADRLIVCNGWMPRLRLWRQVGGALHLTEDGHFSADGEIEAVKLAGSAAGYHSMSGCIESGIAAIQALTGRQAGPVEDERISELFETPDAPLSPAALSGVPVPAYFDTGASLTHIVGTSDNRHRTRFVEAPAGGVGWLSPADVSGLAGLGRLDRAEAAAVLLERAVDPVWLKAEDGGGAQDVGVVEAVDLPFLQGRFGSSPQKLEVDCESGRRLEPGSLIHTSSDLSDPADAVGVVLMAEGERQFCLIDDSYADADYPLVARGTGGVARLRLVQVR